jgi:ribA/ribD-fused uncharacterized protein
MKPKDKKPRYKNVYKVSDIAINGFFEEHRFLSNFHLCEIEIDGRFYPSTENAYQAMKFPDVMRKQFQFISPKESKSLGNVLKMNKEQIERWEQKKLDVMREVCEYKFFNHPDIAKMLVSTGDRYLEETNYWMDTYWGVYSGFGENNLGKILMDIRNKLKEM